LPALSFFEPYRSFLRAAMNQPTIGIRREDINPWERRAPLTPREVACLVADEGLSVIVQPSDVRAFGDDAYARAGATVADDLGPCDVIFGVKEVPPERVLADKTYVIFAHVIKGQPANMPMLRRLVERRCSLVDYELVVDDEGRRLVFFGRYAGLAGMIDTLRALGRRLAREGRETPFATLKAAWEYGDLEDARAAVAAAGERVSAGGVGADLAPLVVAFAGYGNVSRGAQEILALLPHEELPPAEVAALASRAEPSDKLVYKTVFEEEHMVRPKEVGARFDLQDYYDHPEKYEPVLAEYLPYLTVLVNCVYWDARYPHFVSKAVLASLYDGDSPPRLRVIGDLSCDVEGAVEATVKQVDSGSPVYVYDVDRGEAVDGVGGNGPVILAVPNLPAELPRESSVDFASRLEPYVAAVARADWRGRFDAVELPAPVKAATILFDGEFTPTYEHLENYIR
jgi:saccharopine dehydrogenase (NAD+, L-lysine-forming)